MVAVGEYELTWAGGRLTRTEDVHTRTRTLLDDGLVDGGGNRAEGEEGEGEGFGEHVW